MVSKKQLKDAKEELAKQYKCKPSEIEVDKPNEEILEILVVPTEPDNFDDWTWEKQDKWRDNHSSEMVASVEVQNNNSCCGLLELDGINGITTSAIATLLLDYLQNNHKEALVFATATQAQSVPRRALEGAGFVVAGRGKSKKTNNTITLLVAPLHRAA